MSNHYYHVQFQLTASAVCELPFAGHNEREEVQASLSRELSFYTNYLSEPGNQRNPAYRSFGYYDDKKPGQLHGKLITTIDWKNCKCLIADYQDVLANGTLAEKRVKKLRLMNSEQVRALAIEAVARDKDIGAILDDLHPDFLGSKFDGSFYGELPGSGLTGGLDPYGLFNS